MLNRRRIDYEENEYSKLSKFFDDESSTLFYLHSDENKEDSAGRESNIDDQDIHLKSGEKGRNKSVSSQGKSSKPGPKAVEEKKRSMV